MSMLVLSDRMDLSLFDRYPQRIIIDKLSKDEACFEIEFRQEEGELINTITNEEMLVELSDLCGFIIEKGKKQKVKLKERGDRIFVVKKEDNLEFYEILVD